MSLETRITARATSVAAQINTLNSKRGDLTALTTVNKSSLVAAANELKAAIDAMEAVTIDDLETSSSTETWSIDKISNEISEAINGILDGAPAALDTLNELAAALQDDASSVSDIIAAQAKRVRVDAVQTFSGAEKIQGRANIGAQEAAAIGDTDHDFAADFTGALS